jgi:hypothetical protein
MQRQAANALLSVVIMAMPLSAQRSHAPMGSMQRSVRSLDGRAFEHSAFPRAVYLGTPYWMDDGYGRNTETPSVIVIQAPPSAAASFAQPPEETKPVMPLMIEWQGDRYVRRDTNNAGARTNQPDYVAEARTQPAAKHSSSASQPPVARSTPVEPPPATLVFRDGHREQSSDYSIVSGVIYARGDYWTNGYWTKEIPVSQLDLPATFKANQEHGVVFRLPAAANEVVTRP